MIKIIQSGKNINSIYSLFNRFILKTYTHPDKRVREQTGIHLWHQNIADSITPRQYLNFGKIGIFHQLQNKRCVTKDSKGYALEKLAKIYSNLYFTYRYYKDIDKEDYLNWNIYLKKLFNRYHTFKTTFKKYLTHDENLVLENAIKYLHDIEWSSYAKIPLHRDLHWDNILLNDGQISIIDFEHFCLGPLEYEFCNSIFWDDYQSIDFIKMCSLLKKFGIDLNQKLVHLLVTVYFIEQFFYSYINIDTPKIKLLSKTFREFLRKNGESLMVNHQHYFNNLLST